MDRDAKWLAWFEQQFSMVAGSDRQIDLQEFKNALHVKDVSTTNLGTSPPILDVYVVVTFYFVYSNI